MKKKIFEYIVKTNQILLFAAAIIVIFAVGKNIVRDFFRDRYVPPKVELVESSDNNQLDISEEYQKEYLGQVEGIHVVGLRSEKIDKMLRHRAAKDTDQSMAFIRMGSDISWANYVNLMFVPENGESYVLFESDGFVKAFTLAGRGDESRQKSEMDKNLYVAVTLDTNDDGYLDHEDRADIFVSEYDGKNVRLVLEDVDAYNVIGDNNILITQGEGSKKEFFVYKVDIEVLRKLDTSINLVEK